jgi:glutamyl-tRNA synthetase
MHDGDRIDFHARTTSAQDAPPRGGAGRFAPTPTGRLHIGNARTALLAWLWARHENRRALLRVEDLDPEAIPPGVLEGQYADLAWLGLAWDESPLLGGPGGPYRQSERFDRYDAALRRLDEMGLLYPCWCSRKEVLAATRAPHASDDAAVYPGTCRPAQPRPLGAFDDLPSRNGRRPALRIHLDAALEIVGPDGLAHDDLVAGPMAPDPAALGDFVVRRVDGVAAYQVACAWDDDAMGCDQVLRGADLLPSTARQVLLLRLWGCALPRYAHPGLVVDADGERLAKRNNAISLAGLRDSGIPPQAVRRMLARLSGLPDTGDLAALTEAFDVHRLDPNPVPLPAGYGSW